MNFIDTVIHKEISSGSFKGRDIQKYRIPDGVRIIRKEAFKDSTIEKVFIPDSVTLIEDYAFSGCTKLTYVRMSIHVKEIGKGVFEECASLEKIRLPDSLERIGEEAFLNCSQLSEIALPDGIDTISTGMFSGCSALSNITIPEVTETIGNKAFFQCKNLKKIKLPRNLNTIGKLAFSNCSQLSKLTLPNKIKKVGDSAFSGCKKMTTATLPESLVKIPAQLFEGCESLEKIVVGALPPATIEKSAFINCNVSLSIVDINESNSSDYVISWYSKLAELGYTFAEVQLGSWYYMGLNVEQNYDLARKFLLSASEKGDVSASTFIEEHPDLTSSETNHVSITVNDLFESDGNTSSEVVEDNMVDDVVNSETPPSLICPKCGYELPPIAKFCAKCGFSLIEEKKDILCEVCGSVILEDAMYCMECGSPVSNIDETVSQDPVEQLLKLVELKDCGLITEDDFALKKMDIMRRL